MEHPTCVAVPPPPKCCTARNDRRHRGALKRGATAVLGALLVWGATGCAPMSAGPPVVTDVPTSSENRSLPNGQVRAAIVQDGAAVDVSLTRECDVHRIDKFDQVTTRSYHNDAPQNDWWAFAGGAALAGAGVYGLVSPGTIESSGKVSSGAVTAGSITSVAVGGILLAVPLIDYVREHRVAERTVQAQEAVGPTIEHGVVCGPPVGGGDLKAAFANQASAVLGYPDARGHLSFNLDASTPASVPVQPDAFVAISYEGTVVGRASLAPIFAAREAALWSSIQQSPCASSDVEGACADAERYAADLDAGQHIFDVRRLLVEYRTRRDLAAERAAWSATDPVACAKGKGLQADAVQAACVDLARYVLAYPEGPHVEEAKASVLAGETVITRLRAREAREYEASNVAEQGGFIAYEGNGGGPTLCSDGMYSHSSGRGTCSHHGGVSGGGSFHSGGGHRSSGRSGSYSHSSGGSRSHHGRR
jgi:uncharacterized membrane protein YgcG